MNGGDGCYRKRHPDPNLEIHQLVPRDVLGVPTDLGYRDVSNDMARPPLYAVISSAEEDWVRALRHYALNRRRWLASGGGRDRL